MKRGKTNARMKIVYVSHAIKGDVEANLKDLARIIRHINLTYDNIVPFAPYYADVIALNDNIPSERCRGIENNVAYFAQGTFAELWLTGPILSDGMKSEKSIAESIGIPVVDYINRF